MAPTCGRRRTAPAEEIASLGYHGTPKPFRQSNRQPLLVGADGFRSAPHTASELAPTPAQRARAALDGRRSTGQAERLLGEFGRKGRCAAISRQPRGVVEHCSDELPTATRQALADASAPTVQAARRRLRPRADPLVPRVRERALPRLDATQGLLIPARARARRPLPRASSSRSRDAFEYERGRSAPHGRRRLGGS